MQTSESLLPNDLHKTSQCVQSTPLIAGFTVSDKLDYQDGDASEQKHVDEAALVEHKLQDEPNNQQARPDDPHFRFLPGLSARISNSSSVGESH